MVGWSLPAGGCCDDIRWERDLEPAARALAAVPALPDRHADPLAPRRRGELAARRVARRHRRQRAAVATDDEDAVALLQFGQAADLVQRRDRHVEPRPEIARPG